MRKNTNCFLIRFLILIFFFSVFCLTSQGYDNSESVYAYQVAENIFHNQKLGFNEKPEGIFTLAPNGISYASHEIGNALFLLPNVFFMDFFFKFLGSSRITDKTKNKIKEFFMSLQFCFYLALSAMFFFDILNFGFKQPFRISFLSTLLLVFTTYFWTYTRSGFDGVLSCLFLTISLSMLLRFKKTFYYRYLIFTFCCLGFGFITRLTMILPILSSLLFICLFPNLKKIIKLKCLSLAFTTLIPFIAWQCWYNHLRTGKFLLSPVLSEQYSHNNGLDGNLWLGLSGLLLSPGKSIFVYSPLLLYSIFSIRFFNKKYRHESIYVCTLFLLWLYIHGRMRNWAGNWGWGPRYFITVLPVIFLPFAVNLSNILKKNKNKLCFYFLAISGFILTLSSIVTNFVYRTHVLINIKKISFNTFHWDIRQNQAIDGLLAALENIRRITTGTPLPASTVNVSEFNLYSSNTINIWLNTMVHFNIYKTSAIYLAFFLSLTAITSLFMIIRICKKTH